MLATSINTIPSLQIIERLDKTRHVVSFCYVPATRVIDVSDTAQSNDAKPALPEDTNESVAERRLWNGATHTVHSHNSHVLE